MYKLVKKMSVVLILVLVTVLVSGCNSSSDKASDSAQSKGGDVGFTGKQIGLSFEGEIGFFVDLANTFVETAGSDNSVTVYYSEDDVTKQVSDFENMIAMSFDLIFVSPIEPASMVGCYQQAEAAGIPVVVVTHTTESPELIKGCIYYDNYELGRLAAEILAEAMDYSGSMVIYTVTTSQDILDRSRAAEDVMASYGITVAGTGYGIPISVESYPAYEALLSSNPEITGMWGYSPPCAPAAAAVCEAAGRDDIQIVTIALDDEVSQLIREGKIYGSAGQTGADFVPDMIAAAKKIFDGTWGENGQIIVLEPYKVTKDNVEQYWSFN